MTTHLLRLLLPALFLTISSSLFGGEVTKIKKKKGSIYINEGKKAGIKKGDKIAEIIITNGNNSGPSQARGTIWPENDQQTIIFQKNTLLHPN